MKQVYKEVNISTIKRGLCWFPVYTGMTIVYNDIPIYVVIIRKDF